jgi:hypothetical protein
MEDKYIIKLWDKCDKKWYKVAGPFNENKANEYLSGITLDGTVNSKPSHGDYYKIFKLQSNIIITKLK